ncbi:U-box domain-containing protein 28-like [Sesbania bispinosa]|nr:U-box domain-containing protein 28-like [Sesbania bispinosa]
MQPSPVREFDGRFLMLTKDRCLGLLAVAATCANGREKMVATCTNGREEMASKLSCKTAVVERMAKASKSAAEDAVVVLWSLCFVWYREGEG